MGQDGFVGKDTQGKPADSVGEQLVAQGATIIKLENTTQMSVAVQRPRDEVKILSDALKELDTYPSMADEVMYNKPVGKEDGKQKYATGMSIRAAESLANRWSNSAFGCDIVSEDEQGVILAAVFLDYENNTRHIISKKVSRFYKASKASGGGMVRIPDDRFADVVIPSNQSKILREVILRSLPAGLKSEYEDKARAILGSGDKNKRTTKLVAGFMRLGVSKPKLEEFAGKKVEELTPEEITELIGVGNAIRDGETTIDQMIIEKSGGEKLAERMAAAKNGAQSGPAAPTEGAKPAADVKDPAKSATPEGLTGIRLDLYGKVADMAAGDVLEINTILSRLSAGLIKDKETLMKADDALVTSVTNKLTAGKGK